MWRDWFTFSKQDRRAIILLSLLIVITSVLVWTRSRCCREGSTLLLPADSIISQLVPQNVSQPIVKINMHAFDPNIADSLELLSVGLSPYVVRNILRYRMAGGVFRRPGDLARIYGLDDTVFMRVKPYIEIPQEKRINQIVENKAFREKEESSAIVESVNHEHPYAEYMRAKHKPGEFVDLNLADTAELMKIPGIGPVYARMIVEYRHRLGGFYSVSQLRELEPLPEELGDWVYVNAPRIEKLYVNKLSVTQLRSHPYLTFYQAKAISELRKREGNIRSIRQLLFLDEFTEEDIDRLKPYLSFE